MVRLTAVALVMGLLASSHAARADEALSLQQSWALAAGAMLTERNGERHDSLAGTNRTERDAEQVRGLLRQWWGVRDRASLLSSLDWLEATGHRNDFEVLGQQLARLTPEQRQAFAARRRTDPELNHKMAIVEVHHPRLGKKSIVGWRVSRYIWVCRSGYAAGYLTEADAWARIIPAARIIRHTFASWRELGENYLIGRQFWSPEQHARNGHLFQQAMDRLLTNPSSPWTRLPWDVDLGPPPAPLVTGPAAPPVGPAH